MVGKMCPLVGIGLRYVCVVKTQHENQMDNSEKSLAFSLVGMDNQARLGFKFCNHGQFSIDLGDYHRMQKNATCASTLSCWISTVSGFEKLVVCVLVFRISSCDDFEAIYPMQ